MSPKEFSQIGREESRSMGGERIPEVKDVEVSKEVDGKKVTL